MRKRHQPISIVIADDHPAVLQGVVSVLRANGMQVLATCDNGGAAVEAIRRLQPTVAVLDMRMPDLSGLDVLRKVVATDPEVKVVFLTATASDAELAAAIVGGAKGIVLKESALDELVTCIRIVAANGHWFSSDLNEALDRESEPQPVHLKIGEWLTCREREVMLMVAEGVPNKEVARRLGLSEGTVKIHLHNIYEKLGVPNRTALTAIAITHRDELRSALLSPPSQSEAQRPMQQQ